VAFGATAIAVLHPQFLLAALTVNPDALLILLGAALWWLLARIIAHQRPVLSAGLLIIVAVAAVVTKRNSVPIVAAALAVAVATVAWSRGARLSRTTVAAMAAAGVVALTAVAWVWFGGMAGIGEYLILFFRDALRTRRPIDSITLRQVVDYAVLSIDYVWLVAGWLRFDPPDPWLWIVRTATIVGFGGALALTIRSAGLRAPMTVAWTLLLVHGGVLFAWGFLTLASPQARYVFPVLAPATALLFLGWTTLMRRVAAAQTVAVILAVLAMLDATSFALVLVPAYLPWG
jgi:hypothetical protein